MCWKLDIANTYKTFLAWNFQPLLPQGHYIISEKKPEAFNFSSKILVVEFHVDSVTFNKIILREKNWEIPSFENLYIVLVADSTFGYIFSHDEL